MELKELEEQNSKASNLEKKDKMKKLAKKKNSKKNTKKLGEKKEIKTGIQGIAKSKFGRKLAMILMACIVIPSFLTGILIFTQFKTYVQEDIYSNNETVLTTIDEYVENQLKAIEKVSTVLSEIDYVQNMQPLLVKSIFTNVESEFNLIQNLQVVDKQGKIVYSSDGETGTLDADYYQEAMNGTINYSEVIGIDTPDGMKQVIKQAIPVRRNDNINGVLVVSISIDKFNLLIQSMALADNLEVIVVDSNSQLIAFSNADHYDLLSTTDFTSYEPFVRAVSGDNNTMAYQFEGTNYLTSFKGIDALGWGVVTQIPAKVALAHISRITLIFIASIVVLALIGLVITYVLTMYTIKPLNLLSSKAKSLSEGDFGIQVEPVLLKRKDEFGDLGNAFNELIQSFLAIVTRIKDSTDILDTTTLHLVDASEASNDALSQIIVNSSQLREASHKDIEISERVVDGVEEMAKGSENVALNTEKLNVLIKNNVEFATAGEEMMAKTSSLVQETFKSYEAIENRIQALEKSAQAIGGITDTIMAISNQTNLLALNAAIEAARAGEAGKGFSVVAGEIRNLADQSNKSAESITDIIKDIQTDVGETSQMFKKTSTMLENVVTETDKTVSQISEILTDSKNAAEAVDEISAVTEEQAASSAQINEMMDDMRDSIKTTSVVSDDMATNVEAQKVKTEETIEIISDIKKLSQQLKAITEQFKY